MTVSLIFNLAPHYNESIYKELDREFDCQFFIGDSAENTIKLMDYDSLKGFKKRLNNIRVFGHFYYQKGVVMEFLRSNSKLFIITGEPYCLSTWFVLFLSILSNKKTILWTHGWYGDESLMKKSVKKIFFKMANRVFLYGNYALELMVKDKFSRDNLICVYNSIDYDKQSIVRQQLNENSIFNDHFKNTYPTIIYVGRIQKVKRLDLLIGAVNELKITGQNCNLVIVGSDNENLDLNNLVHKLGLQSQVWFYGPCFDETTLGQLFFNSRVCVSPGNVGLTAIHSMGYGTPVITHNNFVEQMPEFEVIEEGVNGSFFIQNDILDLVSKIKFWINMDEDNRIRSRDNCVRAIESNYTSKAQIQIIKKAIKNI
jgi:glycosyltransferase involved in cell wall biosynthesis